MNIYSSRLIVYVEYVTVRLRDCLLLLAPNAMSYMRHVISVQLRRGLSLMKLAFSLESWEACGGDSSLSGDQALQEGNRHIDSALAIFEQVSASVMHTSDIVHVLESQ